MNTLEKDNERGLVLRFLAVLKGRVIDKHCLDDATAKVHPPFWSAILCERLLQVFLEHEEVLLPIKGNQLDAFAWFKVWSSELTIFTQHHIFVQHVGSVKLYSTLLPVACLTRIYHKYEMVRIAALYQQKTWFDC